MPDPFTTLPAPLPLLIIEKIEHLPTLHHLLQASPTVSFIFSRDYARIIEGIVSKYSAWVQGLISIILKLREGDRESLVELTGSDKRLEWFLQANLPSENLPPQYKQNTPTSLYSARGLLRTADTIQKLANRFLETHLRRTHAVMSLYSIGQRQKAILDRSGATTNDTPAEFSHFATPSWLEEQRVLKSLWRLQLYIDVLAIRLPHFAAPSDDKVAKMLRYLGPGRLCSFSRESEFQELDYVHEHIIQNVDCSGCYSDFSRFLEVLPRLKASRVPTPVSYMDPGIDPHFYIPADRATAKQAPGAQFLYLARHVTDCPLRGLDTRPFRYLGFGVWDLRRIVALGLLPDPHDHVKRYKESKSKFQSGLHMEGETFDETVSKWQQLLTHISQIDTSTIPRSQSHKFSTSMIGSRYCVFPEMKSVAFSKPIL